MKKLFIVWASVCALAMVAVPENASAKMSFPTSIACNNLPAIPACPAAPACPAVTVPACPAAPAQQDFSTAVPASPKTYATAYAFKVGTMPTGGQPGYAGGFTALVAYTVRMEVPSTGSAYRVHEWEISNNPMANTTFHEIIRYVEYPNLPRNPDVEDILFGMIMPKAHLIDTNSNAEADRRFRLMNVRCKTKIPEVNTAGGAPVTSMAYYYLMSNNPSATSTVSGKSYNAQNCTISGYTERNYYANDGLTQTHQGPSPLTF